ncbi:hypothetical protein Tco_0967008 [Tanacetum coccineum]
MSSYNHFGCSYCGGPFNGGNCLSSRNVGSGDEFVYDPNPYSYNETPNFFNQPPQYQYETYSCEFYGGDFHPGYDCQTGNTPVFDQGPCYNQDFGFNQPLHYFPSQPQQILCDNYGVLHRNVQCQPMNQNYDLNFCYDPIYSCFDQYQPSQFSKIHHPQATDTELLKARENLMEAIKAFLKEYDHIPPEEKCMALLLAEERFLKIKQTMEEEQNQPEVMQELLLKLMNDLQVLKGIQLLKEFTPKQEEPAVQSFTPYGNFSMIDIDEKWQCGSTTTHANNSLPEYDSFLFEVKPDQGGLTSIVIDEISDNSTNDTLLELSEFESFHFDPSFPRPPSEPPDVKICLNFKPDTTMINNFDEPNEDEYFDPEGGEIDVSQNVEDDDSFTFVIWTFLPFLTYHVDSTLLLSTGSEDTIFDLGIST